MLGLAHIGERNMGARDNNALIFYFLQCARESFQLHAQPRRDKRLGVGQFEPMRIKIIQYTYLLQIAGHDLRRRHGGQVLCLHFGAAQPV